MHVWFLFAPPWPPQGEQPLPNEARRRPASSGAYSRAGSAVRTFVVPGGAPGSRRGAPVCRFIRCSYDRGSGAASRNRETASPSDSLLPVRHVSGTRPGPGSTIFVSAAGEARSGHVEGGYASRQADEGAPVRPEGHWRNRESATGRSNESNRQVQPTDAQRTRPPAARLHHQMTGGRTGGKGWKWWKEWGAWLPAGRLFGAGGRDGPLLLPALPASVHTTPCSDCVY